MKRPIACRIGGVADLWFDTREDFSAALASEAGRAALAEAGSMVSDLRMLQAVGQRMLPHEG